MSATQEYDEFTKADPINFCGNSNYVHKAIKNVMANQE